MTTQQPRPWKKWELGVFTGVAVLVVGGLGLWIRGNLGPETAPSTLGAASKSKGELHVLLHPLVAGEGLTTTWSADKLDDIHMLFQQQLRAKLTSSSQRTLVLHSPDMVPSDSDKAVALHPKLLVYVDEKSPDIIIYKFKVDMFKWESGREQFVQTPIEEIRRVTLGDGKTELSAAYEKSVLTQLVEATTTRLLQELEEL